MAHTPESASDPVAVVAPDTIDQLAGIAPDSRLARLRAQRLDVSKHAEGSFQALFEPADLAGVSRFERETIALRVAVLTPSAAVAASHRERLRKLNTSDATIAAIEHYPGGSDLSARTLAILRFTDLLTLHPSVAVSEHIAELKDVGLAPRDIVTIAQVITFVTFQVRALVGLRLLGEEK